MKTLKVLCVILLYISATFNLQAQDTKAQKKAARIAEVKNLIKNMDYIFLAQFVTPERGGMRTLTGPYELNVSKDKVTAYLPYFGRIYSAPMNANEGGIKLTSKNFVYKVNPNKKGGWEITIKPDEQSPSGTRDVDLFRLNISADGKASLMVTGINRDPISFDGNIETKAEN